MSSHWGSRPVLPQGGLIHVLGPEAAGIYYHQRLVLTSEVCAELAPSFAWASWESRRADTTLSQLQYSREPAQYFGHCGLAAPKGVSMGELVSPVVFGDRGRERCPAPHPLPPIAGRRAGPKVIRAQSYTCSTSTAALRRACPALHLGSIIEVALDVGGVVSEPSPEGVSLQEGPCLLSAMW